MTPLGSEDINPALRRANQEAEDAAPERSTVQFRVTLDATGEIPAADSIRETLELEYDAFMSEGGKITVEEI